MRFSFLLTIVLLAFGVEGRADEPKKPSGTKKQQVPKLDLSLPTFEQLPSDEGLRKPTAPPPMTSPVHSDPGEGFTLVALTHAKTFVGTIQGLKPAAPMAQVELSGNPLTTEPFTTVVRVRSPARRSSSVEVTILDPREHSALEAKGQLVFKNSDEAEWAVDWAPTGVRSAGEFQVQVRVGGLILATSPLKFAETSR
jgi:hypothetical protein